MLITLRKEAKFTTRCIADPFHDCIVKTAYSDILKTAKVVPLHKKGSKLPIVRESQFYILSIRFLKPFYMQGW